MTDTTIDKNKSGKLNIFPALLSMILPGLGQLIQLRVGAALGHMTLTFAVLLGSGPILQGDEIFPCLFQTIWGWCFLLYIPLVSLSVLDAATWDKERGSFLKREIRVLAFIVVPVYFIASFATINSSFPPESMKRARCVQNLRQIAIALHNYHDHYRFLPPAYTVDDTGRRLHSWRVLLLPFLEQSDLYEKIRLNEPWDSEHNRQFHAAHINDFRCRPDRSILMLLKKKPELELGNCYYSIVIGPEAIFSGHETPVFEDIRDGLPNTILLVERFIPVCWMDPNHEIPFDTACKGINCDPLGIGSGHLHGANCCFVDGSVKFLEEGTELKPYLTKSAKDSLSTP